MSDGVPYVGRVRASALDGYEYYMAEETQTTERYVADIATFSETAATRFGTLFHKAIEEAASGNRRPWDWPAVLSSAPDISLLKPQAFEFPAREYREIDGETVLVIGHCDGIRGRTIIDYKTTANSIDLENYIDKWQWRAYLTLNPRAERFRYEIFKVDKARTRVMEHDWVEVSRYSGMEDEVYDMIATYWRFLKELRDDGWITIEPNGYLTLGPTHPKYVQEAIR